MNQDPIVTEVRKAGHALAEQAGGDLHAFFELLRTAQKQYADRLVQPPIRPSEAAEAGPQRGEAHRT